MARAVLVLVHGRGASANDILNLHFDLGVLDVAGLAPQAPGGTWYPQSFLAPVEENQPHLDHSLEALTALLTAVNMPLHRVALLGFSQGACLALEYAARNPGRYGAVMALTGGLITLDHQGDLAGTPVFLGSGDPDPHVPFSRVQETQQVLQRMGATVDLRRYPGMPHTINQDELQACRDLLLEIAA